MATSSMPDTSGSSDKLSGSSSLSGGSSLSDSPVRGTEGAKIPDLSTGAETKRRLTAALPVLREKLSGAPLALPVLLGAALIGGGYYAWRRYYARCY